MRLLNYPRERPDLRVVSAEPSENEGLTPDKKESLLREQNLFLDELENYGADLSFLREKFKDRQLTFEEIINNYNETLVAHRGSWNVREELMIILERLNLFLKVFNACQELSGIDIWLEKVGGESEPAEFRKGKVQKTVADASLINVRLKRAFLVAIHSSAPHIQGLEKTNPKAISLLTLVSDKEPPPEKGGVADIATSPRDHYEELAERLAAYEFILKSRETIADSRPQASGVVLALRKTRRNHRLYAGGRARILKFPVEEG